MTKMINVIIQSTKMIKVKLYLQGTGIYPWQCFACTLWSDISATKLCQLKIWIIKITIPEYTHEIEAVYTIKFQEQHANFVQRILLPASDF